MFHKYPKTFRILVPQISTKGKHYLSDADIKRLLNGNIIITEKMDGANVAIIRHKNCFKLQKRGSLIDVGEHFQFNFFKAWAQSNYDKLMQIPRDTILYGELMICKHTVFYDMLPDYFLAFAWWNHKTQKFAHHNDMEELCDKINVHTVPIIEQTSEIYKDELFGLIPNPSVYGHEQAEGLVVYNYKEQMRGKVVLRKFQDRMDAGEHWSTKPIIKNIISSKCHCKSVGE
jgi:hypothetical protein